MNENDLDLLLDYWVEGIDESESSDIQRRIGMNSSMTNVYSRLNNTFSPLKRLKEIERNSIGVPAGLASKTFQKIYLLEQQRQSGEQSLPENVSGRRSPDNSSFSPRAQSTASLNRTGTDISTQKHTVLLQPLSLFACICAGFMLIMLPAAYYLQMSNSGNSGNALVNNSPQKTIKSSGLVEGGSSSNQYQAGIGMTIPAIDSNGLDDMVNGRANHSEFAVTQYGMGNSQNVNNRSSQQFRTLQNQTPYAYVDNSNNSSRMAQSNSFSSASANGQLVDLTNSSTLTPSRVQLPEKVVCVQGTIAIVPNSGKAVVIDPRAGTAPVLNEMLPTFEHTIPEQHDRFVCPEKCGHPNQNESDPNWNAQQAWDEGVPPVN